MSDSSQPTPTVQTETGRLAAPGSEPWPERLIHRVSAFIDIMSETHPTDEQKDLLDELSAVVRDARDDAVATIVVRRAELSAPTSARMKHVVKLFARMLREACDASDTLSDDSPDQRLRRHSNSVRDAINRFESSVDG